MTDKLREAMRAQADATGFAPIDVAALTAAGDRTVRRRRTAATAAVGLGIAAAIVLAITFSWPAPENAAIVPADPTAQFRDFEPIIVAGAAVFVGPDADDQFEEVTLEDPVDRLVRDGDAFVYQTALDFDTGVADIRGWADGETTDLGTGSDLTIDHDGHLAAWIEPGDVVNRLQILDTRTMTTTSLDLEGADRPRLHDIDDGVAYLTDARGGVAIDVATGVAEPVDNYVVDVEDGVVVAATPDALDEESNTTGFVLADGLIATVDGRQTRLAGTRSGMLSPDGRWFATSDLLPAADGAAAGAEPSSDAGVDVVDTSTGERTALGIKGASDAPLFAAEPVGWLDADTLSVYVMDEAETTSLLSCDIGSGTCAVVVPDVDELTGTDSDGTVSYPGRPPFDRR